MKKLLTLFTLLLTVCSGAWADTFDAEDISTKGTTSGHVTCLSTAGSSSGNSCTEAGGNYASSVTVSKITSDGLNNYIEIKADENYKLTSPIDVTGVIDNNSDKDIVVVYWEGDYDNENGFSKYEVIKWPNRKTACANTTKSLTFEGTIRTIRIYRRVYVNATTKLLGSSSTGGYSQLGGGTNLNVTEISASATSIATNFTLAWDSNGGSALTGDYTSGTVTSGAAITAPNDPTKDNYTFDGWNTAFDGSGDTAGSTMPAANTTYYATWTQNGTIDANTGSANTTYTATLNATSIDVATAPTKSGYTLTGYWTAATDGTKIANADGTLVANTSYADADSKWNNSGAAPDLYAQWEEIATYTVTYDANGGTGTAPTDATGYNEGDAVTVVDNIGTLTKSGYSVVGWNTDPDATTASHAFGSSFDMGTADVTLYAIWQENFYEFTPTGETSGSSMADGEVVVTSNGGLMKYTPITTTKATLKYATEGVEFGGSGDCLVTITLNDLLKVGSVIVAKLSYGDGKADRGVQLRNSDGDNAGSAWKFTGDGNDHIFTYVVPAGMANTNTFQLKRVGNAYLSSLTVTNCQPGGTITASGWNTYSSIKSLDLSTISGGTAYVAKTNDNTEVTMTKTTAKIAAGTGIMIKGNAGDTFTISTTTDAATLEADNQLVGLPNGGTVAADDYNYVFAWTTGNVSTAGFWYVDEAEPTLGAGKAYLHSVGSNGAKLNIIIDNGETTGISEELRVKSEESSSAYNLAGQKVGADYKGIVIVNGKKVIRK